MIVNALIVAALFAAAYYVPGRLAVALLLPGARRPGETFAVSVGLGIVIVNNPAVAIHGLLVKSNTDGEFGWYSVLAVALALTAALGVLAARRRPRPLSRPMLRRPDRETLALAALTTVATLFYLLNYDVDQMSERCCIAEFASMFNAPKMSGHGDGLKGVLVLDVFRGHRWGSDVLLSPFLALFGRLGFRLVYALQGLVLPALGYWLGRDVFGRPWAGWASALLLAFSPFSVESQAFDENFMANVFGTLALALLLRPGAAVVGAGIAASLYLGIRPESVPQLVFVYYFLHRLSRRGELPISRPLLGFSIALAAFSTMFVAIYIARFVFTNTLHEGLLPQPVPHRFFGLPFDLRYMLNFPFVDEPLRSPYVSYPNLWMHPLDLLRRFGLVLAALVPAGVVQLFRIRRELGVLLIGWFAPLFLIVLVQSNWTAAHKLGIPATSLPPVVLAIVGGAVLFADRAVSLRRKAVFAALGVALPLAFLAVVPARTAPLDHRVHLVQFGAPAKVTDEPVYVEWDRSRFDARLLPELHTGRWHPALLDLRAAQLGEELRHPWMHEYVQPPLEYLLQSVFRVRNPNGPVFYYLKGLGGERRSPLLLTPRSEATRVLALDLTAPPWLAPTPLVVSETESVPLELAPATVHVLREVRVPWSGPALMVALARDAFGTVHVALLPETGVPVGQPPGTRVIEHAAGTFPHARIPVAWPEGAVVRIFQIPQESVARGYVRYVTPSSDTPWSSPPEVVMRW